MGCAGCGAAISPDFAFCPRCGLRQPWTCPGCGFACAPDFAFCPRCGRARDAAAAPTTPPAAADPRPKPRAEVDRRQVTVVFADLCGFTALAERLDPEDVRMFQTALFASLSAAISAFDGYAAKFIGDAVLAIFGAPVAHEDDPERALAAALEMMKRGHALSAEWAPRLGRQVDLHVAIHTGTVVAGSLGGDAAGAAYDVTGDTVNAAARILDAAAPGEILVSDATHALARHRFAFAPPATIALKGKAEPMVVRRLLGPLAEPQSARGLAAHGLVAPLIGRSDELARLMAAFDRMLSGEAQAITVVGEAGIGKSRLIGAFLQRLEAEGRLSGIALRQTACSSLGEPTYGVFASLFREGYHVDADDPLEVAREKISAGLGALGTRPEIAETIMPVLGHLLGVPELRPRWLDPEQLGRQIALAGRTLVEQRTDDQPVLVVIEDFHWADAASAALIHDIIDQLADRRLMLVASQRPEAPLHEFARASRDVLRLAPLAAGEIDAMVAGLFARIDTADLARVQQIVGRRAGGNPLFAEEIVRSLVSRGVLVRDGDRWRCSGACDSVDIPPTLHGLLLSGVDRLPADARRLLQEAAVLGVEFDEWLLDAVATPGGDIAAALDRLVGSGMIVETGHGRDGRRFRFTHALVHEVVYQNLLLSRRSELHRLAGEALERAVGSEPARLGDLEALGHHWSHSSDRIRGARYLVTAGDRASAVYANDDAVRHYRQALATLADCTGCDGDVAGVHERLGDLLALGGGRGEALGHYEIAHRLLARMGDRTGIARLQRKIGGLHWQAGDGERARACFAAGLEHLGDDGSPLERAQLFQEIGRVAFRVGDNAGAIEWAERALAEARAAEASGAHAQDLAAIRVQTFNTLGVALARSGRVSEAVERIEQSVTLAIAHDLLQAACRGYTNLGVLYSSIDPGRSIETCLEGLELAKKVGDLAFQSRLYANLAVAYCALTDRCEAEGIEAAQAAVELDRRLGLIDHLAVPLIVLGQIHQCRGDHRLAFAAYEEAMGLAERVGEPQLLFPCYDGLATLYLDAGNLAMAETYLAKAQELCRRSGLEPDALLMLPYLC